MLSVLDSLHHFDLESLVVEVRLQIKMMKRVQHNQHSMFHRISFCNYSESLVFLVRWSEAIFISKTVAAFGFVRYDVRYFTNM